MYLRPVFIETDDERMQRLIEANPFGLLITPTQHAGWRRRTSRFC